MEATQLPQNEHTHVQKMAEAAGATQTDVARQFGCIFMYLDVYLVNNTSKMTLYIQFIYLWGSVIKFNCQRHLKTDWSGRTEDC